MTAPETDEFSAFTTICAEQGVTVDPWVVAGGTDELEEVPAGLCHMPTRIYGMIATAAVVLRKYPGSALASQTVVPPEAWETNVPLRTMTDLVNGSIAPLEGDGQLESFTSLPAQRVSACPAAEQLFETTMRQISFAPLQPRVNYGYEVFANQQGRPLLLRKGTNEASTLALESILVNGVRYPRGAILRVDAEGDRTGGNNGYNTIVAKNKAVVKAAKTITAVGLVRLSAFALPPEKRQAFRRRSNFYDESSIGEVPASDLSQVQGRLTAGLAALPGYEEL